MEEQEKIYEQKEPVVVFKSLSDRRAMAVLTEDSHEPILEISGYDLQVNLNRDMIHGVEDVENLLEGIKDMYRKIILKELI